MKTSFFIMLITVALTAATASAQFVPRGGGYGPRDGNGYNMSGPRDGTDYGAKAGKRGSGTCDQTGPKGPRQGKGQGRGRR